MKIESKEFSKKEKRQNWIWAIPLILVVSMIICIIIFAFFLSFEAVALYSGEITLTKFSAEFVPQAIGIVCFSVIVSIILFVCSFFTIKFKKECQICNKKDYLDSMVVLNKKQVKGGAMEKCVCKTHKKPYMVKLKYNW